MGGGPRNAAGVNDVTGRSAGQITILLTLRADLHSIRDFLVKKWQVGLPLFQRPNFTWAKGGCVGVALFLAAREYCADNMTNNGHEPGRVAFRPSLRERRLALGARGRHNLSWVVRSPCVGAEVDGWPCGSLCERATGRRRDPL